MNLVVRTLIESSCAHTTSRSPYSTYYNNKPRKTTQPAPTTMTVGVAQGPETGTHYDNSGVQVNSPTSAPLVGPVDSTTMLAPTAKTTRRVATMMPRALLTMTPKAATTIPNRKSPMAKITPRARVEDLKALVLKVPAPKALTLKARVPKASLEANTRTTSLHSMTLDPVAFEPELLSTVEEQTERTSNPMSRLSANRFASGGDGGASGSEVSLCPARHSTHSCASSEAASLFSPLAHGSYLSSGGPSHTPIKLFSPAASLSGLGKEKDRATLLERPATTQSDYRSTAGSDYSSFLRLYTSEQNLKLKDKDGAAKSVGSVSPGKLSVDLPARTHGSGSGSGSGSYTGREVQVRVSAAARPLHLPFLVLTALASVWLFTPSFPSRAGSPFQPTSPTKSAAGGTGSFILGSHRTGTAPQIFGGSQNYRSNGASEAGRSGASETARSGAIELIAARRREVERAAGLTVAKRLAVKAHTGVRPREVPRRRTVVEEREPRLIAAMEAARPIGAVVEVKRTAAMGATKPMAATEEAKCIRAMARGRLSPRPTRARVREVRPTGVKAEAGLIAATVRVKRIGAMVEARRTAAADAVRPIAAVQEARPAEATVGARRGSSSRIAKHTAARPFAALVPKPRGAKRTVTAGATFITLKPTELPAKPRLLVPKPIEARAAVKVPPPPPFCSYHSGSEAYKTHGSDTYHESESRAETHRPDAHTDTEGETYRAAKVVPSDCRLKDAPKHLVARPVRRRLTPRTPGGQYGKALSEASTAPTSAEGLIRQRISREVVTSVPVPSESKAITLGHHGHGQEPMRISALWYLNVHAPPPIEWLRTQAILYPNVLILTWTGPTRGRRVVMLDLVNCTEVRSTRAPSPSHPNTRGDVGSAAARLQSADLAETLCLFQLYTDGVEMLGTDTARERVRWVGAIWDVLATIARGLPRALTNGSESESGTLQLSLRLRWIAETADDISVASLVPSFDAPSLRRTTSIADLEVEADIDRRPAPASSSSKEESNFLSPPRSCSRVSGSDGGGYQTPGTDRARSSRYSASNVTRQENTYVPTDTEQST
ncbi:hypothetical protein RSOLAG22IIIB_05787 [Rhizoctonia solani]|uniref:PH domain-containing protein n=1 Tax=Rhizoctonia solani TaxID=456999 RepID=A0A0K6G9B7_9AGAM|nr:hypothetical protein RSOLAG22IIIB_05787 [Rhizoctonia solani]